MDTLRPRTRSVTPAGSRTLPAKVATNNTRYRALGIEQGLQVAEAKPFGWTRTSVPADTLTAYAAQLVALRAALLAWRRSEVEARRVATPVSPGKSRFGHLG